MKSFEYTIRDEMGLHARPAAVLVKRLKTLPVTVTIYCTNRRADAKKMFALMGMAVKCGETVRVEIEGEDEDSICDELKDFFNENF